MIALGSRVAWACCALGIMCLGALPGLANAGTAISAGLIWQSAPSHADEIRTYTPDLAHPWFGTEENASLYIGRWDGPDFTTDASTTVRLWARSTREFGTRLSVGLAASSGGDPYYYYLSTTTPPSYIHLLYGYPYDNPFIFKTILSTTTLQEIVASTTAGSVIHHGDELWMFFYPANAEFGDPYNAAVGGTGHIPQFQMCEISCDGSPPPPPPCTENCFDNVLFLPGIESSRLYRPQVVGAAERRIWEPPAVGHDNTQLAMTIGGASVEPDIYTKDTLDSVLGVDVYSSFLSAMHQFAATNSITFEAYPYDWRYGADHIASNPTQLATTTIMLLGEIKRLAAGSKTGKITIIAHSNGGLVAKEAMLALGADAPKYVDRLIFVAVPQVGTPQAIAGMLHGYNEALPMNRAPLLITDSEVRTLGANMPGAFGLLPTAGYFSSVNTPVVTFSTSLLDWAARYGGTITSQSGLSAYLTDTAGRTQPIDSDLNDPYILSSNLLSQSRTMHAAIDTWTPPDGVQLIQVAGWGVPTTVSGINYKKKGSSIQPSFNTTIDGDGTVVVPSALWTSTAVGATDYWLDLATYNRIPNRITSGHPLGVDHGFILSISELQQFMSDSIAGASKSLSQYKYLSTTVPSNNGNRLAYILHSPLTLDLYDNLGNHTGISTTTGQMEEQIPGTYYTEFGDVKYLFTDATSSLHIIMNGYATSTFTFEEDELQGDALIASSTWQDMPVTPATKVTLDTQSDISTLAPLRIDKNGDGAVDYTVAPILDGTVTLPKAPLTVTADSKIIVLGSAIPLLTATFSGFVSGDTASASDVTGAANCTTTATATSGVGTYPITCAIGNLASNTYDFTTFTAGTLAIAYRWDGFLQPINDTAHQIGQGLSVFKARSSVPVKLQLKKADGTIIQSSIAPVWLAPQQGSVMSVSVDKSTYSDPSASGNIFKWDPVNQQYIYNWSTKGLAAGYWYKVYAQLDDGKTYSVVVGLR